MKRRAIPTALLVSSLCLGLGLLTTACGSNTPCRTCPPVDGTYSVRWDADGGANPQCPGPRVPTWTLRQRDATVTTEVGGVPLGGTLYDSYDLLLTGSQASVSLRLKGLVIPEGTTADGGIRIQGTFSTRTIGDAGDPCESLEAFTAQRTSR